MDDDGVLSKKHEKWQEEARKEGAALKKKLMDDVAITGYACQHPEISGKEVAKATKATKTKYAIDMARRRRMEKTRLGSTWQTSLKQVTIIYSPMTATKSSSSAMARPYNA